MNYEGAMTLPQGVCEVDVSHVFVLYRVHEGEGHLLTLGPSSDQIVE